MIDIEKIKLDIIKQLKPLINVIKENNIQMINDTEKLLLLSEYVVEGQYAIIHNKYVQIFEKLVEFVKNEIER